MCLVYLVTVVPRAISFYSSFPTKSCDQRFRSLLGVENLAHSRQYGALKNIRLGMIGDRTGVDLLRKNGFLIKKFFQHQRVVKLTDKILYNHCKKLDALLIDIPNSGISSDPMISVLRRLVQFSAQYDKKLIILDRPNPLGAVVEGPGEIPWRHGLTIGEIAYHINRSFLEKPARLEVVPLRRWRRGRLTEQNCVLHPLHCLRATKGKLSLWETRYLKRLCWKLGLHCFDCKNKDVLVNGVRLRVKSDVNSFSLFNSLLTIARFLRNRKHTALSLSRKFDKAVGSSGVRLFLENKISFDALKKEIEQSLDLFYDKSKLCFLYKPFPIVVRPELIRGSDSKSKAT